LDYLLITLLLLAVAVEVLNMLAVAVLVDFVAQ
jgi:hypothetical protein